MPVFNNTNVNGAYYTNHNRLNPLRIGEGFERMLRSDSTRGECLNPLRIGEGFELIQYHHNRHNGMS